MIPQPEAAMEAALRESEERYRLLVESLPDAIIIIADGTIQYANRAWTNLISQALGAEVVGGNTGNLAMLFSDTNKFSAAIEHKDARDNSRLLPLTYDTVQDTIRTVVENSVREESTSIMGLKHDGEIRYLEARAVPVKWNSAEALQFSIRDVTSFKIAEQRLHEYGERLTSLSRQLILTQERERRAIAMELHDEAGHAAIGIKLQLNAILQKADSVEQRKEIQDLTAVVDHYTEKLRELSLDLRPSMLDDLGVVPALEWYIENLNAKSNVRVQFLHPDIRREAPPEVEIACFRIAQEALTNVLRHADAANAVVELQLRDDTLILSIRDDGTGFDVQAVQAAAARGRGMGLLGMQERTVLAFGSFDIQSAPGSGTDIEVTFPLHPSVMTEGTEDA
jgi:signal transduction histidine kinase